MTTVGVSGWIESGSIRFSVNTGGFLTAEWNGSQGTVMASRLFPMTFPDGFVAIRDVSGREWGVLESLAGLDTASRIVLEREASYAPFLPRIVSIRRIRRMFEYWHWEVLTDVGPMRFQTGPLYESTVKLDDGRRLVTDVADQRYSLPAEDEWDARSRKSLAKWL